MKTRAKIALVTMTAAWISSTPAVALADEQAVVVAPPPQGKQVVVVRGEKAEEAVIDPTKEVFWSNAELGVQSLSLRTFVADSDTLAVGFLPDSATGPTLGVGAGVRIVFVTLGVRGRVGMFSDTTPGRNLGNWELWTLDAELGFRVPLHRVEPYLTFSGGYAAIGGLGQAIAGLQQGLDVSGVDARFGLGFDYYVTRHVTLGAQLSGELLFLSRPGISVRDLATAKEVGTLNEAKARVLEANGSSVGGALALTGGLGVHF